MIKLINLKNVASYKSKATLETDKKINLIYGLNGAGKSTFSNFLNQKLDPRFSDCSIEGLSENEEILVYNQNFIRENFYEAENLKGIFTLSKENREAETKINDALKEIEKLEDEAKELRKELENEKLSITKKQLVAKDTVWKIKHDYSGGDRVLEFCLDGYKGSKDNLYNYINSLSKPAIKPQKNIDDLKNDYQSISGDNPQRYLILPKISFTAQSVEVEPIFSKQIVGNENSSVSQLIKDLGNSDWVKAGLKYIPQDELDENSKCPFCQEKTISSILIQNIKSYFDASYEADLATLISLSTNYSQAIQAIPNKSIFEVNPKFEVFRKDFEIKYNEFIKIIESNKKSIEEKIKTPSISISLKDSIEALEELNGILVKINNLVDEHNNNINQKEIFKESIKKCFWEIMRWEYDQVIGIVSAEILMSKSITDKIEINLREKVKKINEQNGIISEQQKKTVNIEEAIENIKNGLIELGITDFEIKKHSDNFYKVVRGENESNIFRSLSEGEKMIISFLYFLELCRGKKEAAETGKKKIIVIDDPISSLSHIYVFNVGRLIKNEFYGRRSTKINKETQKKWLYGVTNMNKSLF